MDLFLKKMDYYIKTFKYELFLSVHFQLVIKKTLLFDKNI